MTDKKDEYYQPWLRDPSPAPEPLPRADEGLAKPKDAPPVGIDVGRYTPKPAPARDPRVTGEQLKAGAARLWSAIRHGAAAFADWTIDVVDTTRIVMTPTKAGQAQAISRAMDTARDIIDKRVNALGTREPTIIRQGDDRIVVQVPGLQDPQQLKDLIGKTARLEFRMVDTNADPNEVAAGRVPVGSEVVPYSPDAGNGVPFEVLRRQVMISGDQLIDAKQSYDPQSGLPVVTIRFDSGGSATFAKVTAQNVGKRFAMVLGADSIRKGAIAGIIATVAVLAFMIVVYGRFGIYANVALFFNIFLIVAIMAAFNATLTLPGIAGFVLTIGAAVDANVLINERIREELKRGRRVFQAVELGYSEASRAIFDANITNVIAAALMFWFGTGPIKGFAVVLTIGIVTSVFTAVTVTRMFAAHWLHKTRPASLNI